MNYRIFLVLLAFGCTSPEVGVGMTIDEQCQIWNKSNEGPCPGAVQLRVYY